MTSTKPTDQTEYILFVVLLKANLLEVLPIARMLREQGVYEPLFLVESKARELLLPTLREEGFSAINPNGNVCAELSGVRTKAPAKVQKTTLKQQVFQWLPSVVRYWVLLRSKKKRMRALLSKYSGIRAIVTIGDRHVGFETALIALGNKLGIPTLIVPFAMSFPQAAAEPRFRQSNFKKMYGVYSITAKCIATLFPKWVYLYKGEPIFFRPPTEGLAAVCFGMMPKSPWIIGGGKAKKMAVESDAVRSMLIEQGMVTDKMVVTGKPSLDSIAKQLGHIDTRKIREDHGLSGEERMILCSVPQLAEHDLLPWKEHWEEMEFLFSTLAQQPNVKLVLSLHPKSDKSKYIPLATKCGAMITDHRIYGVLPACDLFVASYSSTLAQAIALRKPSVVVDFYGLDYPLYKNTPGVTIVKTHEEFYPALTRLLEDDNAYANAVSDLQTQESRWAILDGHNTERVVAELQNLIASVDRAE